MTMLATQDAAEAQTQIPATQRVEAKRREVIPVVDTSQFAQLLDTARFDHLWRVAQLFASSTMVPQHFQGKPNDCFIGMQMAMRLGVDPFMFLQNTYIIGGKPGMEAKLAIALINTSGLFAGPIQYILGGEGDERGCEIAATLKANGQQIRGPRVTLGTAKAEGWYNRSGSKWKTIPDLMAQYRAASWFGRLYCPERLMGMQTVDELQDAGETHIIEQAEAPKGVAATMGRIKRPKPVEMVDAETGEVTQPDAPDSTARTPAPAEGEKHNPSPEAVAGAAESPAAEVVEQFSGPWADFVERLYNEAATYADPELPRDVFDNGVRLAIVKLAKKGKEASISIPQRSKWFAAMKDRKFDYTTGQVKA